MRLTVAMVVLALSTLSACNKSGESKKNAGDAAPVPPINSSSEWGKDPAVVPSSVDINSLKAVPVGASSADEPWIIHLTALRWTDPKTQNDWFISYKAKFPNDERLANLNEYEIGKGRAALDPDLSAESYCRTRNGRLPTQDELAQGLSNGLDQQLDMFRNMSGGIGMKVAEGLWTKTAAPDGTPQSYCNPNKFLMAYDLREREWACVDFSTLSGGVIPQAACMVAK